MAQPNDPFTFILSYERDIIQKVEYDLGGKVPSVIDNADGSKMTVYMGSDDKRILTDAGVDIVKSVLHKRITKVAGMSNLTRHDCIENALAIIQDMNMAITLQPDKYLYYNREASEGEDDKMLQWISASDIMTGLFFDFFMMAEKGKLREWSAGVLRIGFDRTEQQQKPQSLLGNAASLLGKPQQDRGA